MKRSSSTSDPASRLASGVFIVAAAAGVAASAAVAAGGPILAVRWWLLWELGAWAVAWLVALAAGLRLPPRSAVPLIVAAAVALRLAALAGGPTTSDDLYRYSWDGRVQAAGIDPYAAPPSAERLSSQREPWLWPDATGCAQLRRPPGCTRINRPAERTIYPPVAEAWFAVGYRIGGIGARHHTWQLAGLLTELVTVALLPVTLRRWGRDPRWTTLYALCPAPVLEIVNNGHVDGLAVALAVAALTLAVPPRRRRRSPAARVPLADACRGAAAPDPVARDVAVGLLLAGSALVKLYPAVLCLAVVGAPRARPWRSFARVCGVAAGCGLLAYLPHVAAVGVRVLGYLPGYLREERYLQGERFLLVGAVVPPGRLAIGAAALVLFTATAGVAVVAWRRPGPRDVGVALLVALLLVATPVQPWYGCLLLAVATIAARAWPAAVVAAGYPYFFAVILDAPHRVAVGRAAYGVALAVTLAALLADDRSRSRGRAPGRRATMSPSTHWGVTPPWTRATPPRPTPTARRSRRSWPSTCPPAGRASARSTPTTGPAS